MTTMYNPLNNSNVMTHSNQMQQFYTQSASNISQTDQQQIQQQQQINTTPQIQQSYNGQSMHGRLTNTQQRNALRNVGPIVITPATEIIDLSSPPSSPVPPTVQETSIRPSVGWEITRIPERTWAHDSSNNAAYKVNK